VLKIKSSLLSLFIFFPVIGWTSSSTVRTEIAYPLLHFQLPVNMARAPDNPKWLYVLEQGGKIKAFVEKPQPDRYLEILDLTHQVKNDTVFEGLLSLAFHPQYKKNKKFYVSYIAEGPRRLVLSEFKAKSISRVASLKSEREIFSMALPPGTNNAGALVFGLDGTLFFSIGEENEYQPAVKQIDPEAKKLTGSILRIDINQTGQTKNYRIPEDNPFLAESGDRSEVFALGFRNVVRMFVDPHNGDLWGTDNTQDGAEKIILIRKGQNYALTPPVFQLSPGGGEFIIGGGFYSHSKFPELSNCFIFGDMMRGQFWSSSFKNSKFSEPVFLTDIPTPSSITISPKGEILFTSYYGGKIYALKKIDGK